MEPLLDACTISYLFAACQKEFLREAAAASRIHTVLDVVVELERAKGFGDGFRKLKDDLVAAGQWVVHELIIGTPEHQLFQQLRRTKGKLLIEDQGELASIALAAFHPDLVFVTEDRQAMRWAIDELPDFPCRIVRSAAWLRAVRERGGNLDVGGLERWAKVVQPQPLPSWWNDWMIAQSAQTISAV
jgi:hypothetical protein